MRQQSGVTRTSRATRTTALRAAALIGPAAMVVLAIQNGPATAAPERTSGGAALPLSVSARATALESAQASAVSTARELGLGAQEKLVVRDVVKDANGTVHTRYERTYAGLPVLGGDLVTHVTRSGALKGVSKATAARISMASTDAGISAAAAKKTALRAADSSDATSATARKVV